MKTAGIQHRMQRKPSSRELPLAELGTCKIEIVDPLATFTRRERSGGGGNGDPCMKVANPLRLTFGKSNYNNPHSKL